MVTNRRLQSTQPIPFRTDRLKGPENDGLGGKGRENGKLSSSKTSSDCSLRLRVRKDTVFTNRCSKETLCGEEYKWKGMACKPDTAVR